MALTVCSSPLARARAPTTVSRPAISRPVGEHVVVEGCGHYIHHDRPEQVIKAIDDVVLRQMDAGQRGSAAQRRRTRARDYGLPPSVV
jgi:hypothetical protein